MEGTFINGFTILVSLFVFSFLLFLGNLLEKDKMTRKNIVKDSKSGHLSLKRRIDVLVFFFFSVGPHMKHGHMDIPCCGIFARVTLDMVSVPSTNLPN